MTGYLSGDSASRNRTYRRYSSVYNVVAFDYFMLSHQEQTVFGTISRPAWLYSLIYRNKEQCQSYETKTSSCLFFICSNKSQSSKQPSPLKMRLRYPKLCFISTLTRYLENLQVVLHPKIPPLHISTPLNLSVTTWSSITLSPNPQARRENMRARLQLLLSNLIAIQILSRSKESPIR